MPERAGDPARRAAPWQLALGAVVVGYLALGTAYTLLTPPWQAPDEPAHFNYVAQVAANPWRPPRIAAGDWDAERLEALKAARFPAGASIDGIAYEDHQPPAYYYLAALAWRAAPGTPLARLRAVRLIGVGLGLVTVIATFVALWAFVADPVLAVAGAGFVAFLPMQLAVTSAANNDALANALAASALSLAALRLADRVPDRVAVGAGGLIAGLAFMTKLTAAPAVVVLAVAELVRAPGRGGYRRAAVRVASLSALAFAIAMPWAARNARVYGGWDVFGLRAHDVVVVGQPRTAAWLAEHGLAAFLQRAAVFSFESFWGVFGWMGVFLDQRIYAALALATAVAGAGALRWAVVVARDEARGHERRAAIVLGSSAALAVAGFAWYNLGYVQHQGRYVFAALPAWAGLFLLGLREVAGAVGQRVAGGRGRRLAGAAAMAGFALGLAGLAWLALVRYAVPGLR